MNKVRKPLNEIMEKFDDDKTSTPPTTSSKSVEADSAIPANSLAAQLANPKKKTTKIRFTLDLEKPLDDRLTKQANRLRRSKADLARIALEKLLEQLEQ